MKVWKIYRFGQLVREVNGDERKLLEWIQSNVPAANKSGIRTGDVLFNKYLLYEDARKAGFTINSRK
ncbi:MAG: hypothetical protein IJ714_01405 [Bacteroidales bacterium]|nr:hypothetical protein [Bacteroidales bacterium]